MDLQSAKALALHDPFQFEWWALSLVSARPFGGKTRGADSGIDGLIYLLDPDNPTETKKALVQVKSGKVQARDIRDLKGVVEREGAKMGVFVTLEKPTKPMVVEATRAGFVFDHIPKIQIFTIEELFNGGQPKIPYQPESRKKAERVREKRNNVRMF